MYCQLVMCGSFNLLKIIAESTRAARNVREYISFQGGPKKRGHRLMTIIMSNLTEKQAINDRLQGIVATYLRCGGDVNNQIKKGLLPSLSVKEINR